MPKRPNKPLFPNPFYVLLLVSSAVFLVTVLAYLIGPFVHQQHIEKRAVGPGPGSVALADWLDRNGPWALGLEFVVMLVSGLLAMVSDRFFSSRTDPKPEARPSD